MRHGLGAAVAGVAEVVEGDGQRIVAVVVLLAAIGQPVDGRLQIGEAALQRDASAAVGAFEHREAGSAGECQRAVPDVQRQRHGFAAGVDVGEGNAVGVVEDKRGVFIDVLRCRERYFRRIVLCGHVDGRFGDVARRPVARGVLIDEALDAGPVGIGDVGELGKVAAEYRVVVENQRAVLEPVADGLAGVARVDVPVPVDVMAGVDYLARIEWRDAARRGDGSTGVGQVGRTSAEDVVAGVVVDVGDDGTDIDGNRAVFGRDDIGAIRVRDGRQHHHHLLRQRFAAGRVGRGYAQVIRARRDDVVARSGDVSQPVARRQRGVDLRQRAGERDAARTVVADVAGGKAAGNVRAQGQRTVARRRQRDRETAMIGVGERQAGQRQRAVGIGRDDLLDGVAAGREGDFRQVVDCAHLHRRCARAVARRRRAAIAAVVDLDADAARRAAQIVGRVREGDRAGQRLHLQRVGIGVQVDAQRVAVLTVVLAVDRADQRTAGVDIAARNRDAVGFEDAEAVGRFSIGGGAEGQAAVAVVRAFRVADRDVRIDERRRAVLDEGLGGNSAAEQRRIVDRLDLDGQRAARGRTAAIADLNGEAVAGVGRERVDRVGIRRIGVGARARVERQRAVVAGQRRNGRSTVVNAVGEDRAAVGIARRQLAAACREAVGGIRVRIADRRRLGEADRIVDLLDRQRLGAGMHHRRGIARRGGDGDRT